MANALRRMVAAKELWLCFWEATALFAFELAVWFRFVLPRNVQAACLRVVRGGETARKAESKALGELCQVLQPWFR